MESIGDVSKQEAILQLVFCCIARDETVGLGLGEQRDRRKSVGSLPGFLEGVACGLVGCAGGVGLGYTGKWEEGS